MNNDKSEYIVGKINKRVIKLLNLTIPIDTPIYIRQEKIKRIKVKHPGDFRIYGKDISKILKSPDYVAKHLKNNSISFIKVYKSTGDYVLVAVRPSRSEKQYVRTLFIMANEKVYKYWIKNALKTY